jgi:hypothetical protein
MGATVAYGGRLRGNVFVASHHPGIRDRDIDLDFVSETANIHINLSSAGSKLHRPRGVEASFVIAVCLRTEGSSLGLRGWDFIVQGMATAISGSERRCDVAADRGIVKSGAALFKIIRHTTAKN